MTFVQSLDRLNVIPSSILDPLQPVFLFVLRVYVSWQFLKSGVLKLQDW